MSDFKGVEITDIFGLEKTTKKLIETISNGVGKVYEPIHIRRIAKAKRDEIKIIGEAIIDNIDLPIKYDNGEISVESTDIEELIKRTRNRVLYKELRKQQNIEAIIDETYNLLEKEEYVTAEPVNTDWIYQFFDMAGEISDEHMQKLWAQILAGEIKQPNACTLRTLTTLKNINTREALLFEQIAPLIIFHDTEPFIYKNYELLNEYGISFDNLLLLEDCGLIKLSPNVSLKTETCALYNHNLVLFFSEEIIFPDLVLSESGVQIINLIKNSIKFNNEYFLKVCNELKLENLNIQFNVYEMKNKSCKRCDYDEEKEWMLIE